MVLEVSAPPLPYFDPDTIRHFGDAPHSVLPNVFHRRVDKQRRSNQARVDEIVNYVDKDCTRLRFLATVTRI